MVESVVGFVVKKLDNLLVSELQLVRGVYGKVQKLKDDLEMMQGFLKDADARKGIDEGIRAWVNQVRRAAHDAEDVIDEFMIRFKSHYKGGGVKGFHRSFTHKVRILKARHDLAKKIKEIRENIKDILQRRCLYGIQTTPLDNGLDTTLHAKRDGVTYFTDQDTLVGFQEDADFLIKKLVNAEATSSEVPKLMSITVAGMGGSGKTSLISRVYNDPKVKAHFDCHAWVSVLQNFKNRDLLKCMLKQFRRKREDDMRDKLREYLNGMDEDDMRDELTKYLEEKRYVLVLDDVWDEKAWNGIKAALPMKFNGSFVVLTTRINRVALALEASDVSNLTHQIKPLPDREALVLFCRKAFKGSEASVPEELKKVCDNMLKKCKGLPLAIAALGGILSGKQKTQLEWEKVYRSLEYHLSDASFPYGQVGNILNLSYNVLPKHLKSCFLYCSLFPEDDVIDKDTLIRLWIAEGFIEEKRPKMSAEEIGEDYLMELIDRSMLLEVHTTYDGIVRFCGIHDLMRALAMQIAKEEEFCLALNTKTEEDIEKYRRLSILLQNKEDVNSFLSSDIRMPSLRSLLTFGIVKELEFCLAHLSLHRMFSSFKLLRVLEAEYANISELPNEVVKLIHLRYLSLRGNKKLTKLPRTIGRLQNLQTLDIRLTGIRSLPKSINEIQSLRHLLADDLFAVEYHGLFCRSYESRYMDYSAAAFSSDETFWTEGFNNLRSLQSLQNITCSGKKFLEEIGKLTALRNLGITNIHGEDADELCAAVTRMTNLSRLSLSFSNSIQLPSLFSSDSFSHLKTLVLAGGLEKLPPQVGSLTNLITLHLFETELDEDPFLYLQSCPNLVHLEVKKAYEGPQLECEAKGFPKLKLLDLSGLKNLENVVLPEGAMPNLKELRISECWQLKRVPQGIKYLTNLQELSLWDMSPEFQQRLRKDGGEDHSLIQHIPLITFGN